MVFKTALLKTYLSILSTISKTGNDAFGYFDVENKHFYIANNQVIARLKIELEDVEKDFPNFTIAIKELSNIVNHMSVVSINPDLSFSSLSNTFQGKLSTNSSILPALSSYKDSFSIEEVSTTSLIFSKEIIQSIKNARFFMNDKDRNIQNRCLHIKDGTIATSSLYRIYLNENCPITENLIISNEVDSFIDFLGEDTNLKLYKDFSLIEKKELSIIVSNLSEIEYFSILDKEGKNYGIIQQLLTEGNSLKFHVNDFLTYSTYLTYYAEQNTNNIVHIISTPEGIELEANSNKVNLVTTTSFLKTPIDFSFDLKSFLAVLGKLTKPVEYVTIYELQELKIFIVEFQPHEYVFFGKFNI